MKKIKELFFLSIFVIANSFIFGNASSTSLENIKENKLLDMNFNNLKIQNSVTGTTYESYNGKSFFEDGITGKGLRFNGDYVHVKDLDSIVSKKDTITVAFWLRYNWEDDDNQGGAIGFIPISLGNYNLWIRGNEIGFNSCNKDVYGTIQKLPDNTWTHIVAEFNKTNYKKNKLYINGEEIALSQVLGTPVVDRMEFTGVYIGKTPGSTHISKESAIDDILIYDRSLTKEEVVAVYKKNTVPELTLSSDGSHVSASWSTEILEENILWEVGYEEEDEKFLNLVYNSSNGLGTGGQLYDTNEFYSGKQSVYSPNTYKSDGNHTGNWVLYPYTNPSANNHIHYLQNTNVFKNGDKLSISYRIKTFGEASVTILGDWRAEAKINFNTYNSAVTQAGKKGDNILYVSNTSKLKYDREIYFDTEDTNIGTCYRVIEVDHDKGTIKITPSLKSDVEVGRKIAYRKHIWAFEGLNSNFDTKGEWVLINQNIELNNSKYIDWSKEDIKLRQRWTIYGTDAWMDDLKVGYATESVLYRGSDEIYRGYDSVFEDTEAIDKAKPSRLNNVNISSTYDNNNNKIINLTFNDVEDFGTSYTYSIAGVSKDGVESVRSEFKEITVTSGLKGYSYVIDGNPNTIPNNSVNLAAGKLNIKYTKDSSQSGYLYLHIKAIDNAGNIGDTTHILIDKATPNKPEIISPNNDSVFLSGETIRVKWDYTDNDAIITEFIFNVYNSNGKVVRSEEVLPNSRSLQVTLEKGVYNIEIIAKSVDGVTNKSDLVTIRVSNFKDSGIVRTIDIEPGQLLSKISIKTICDIPENTKIIGRIYYKKDDNGNWDTGCNLVFELKSLLTDNDVLTLPEKSSSVKIEYILTKGSKVDISPILDHIVVYGK